jgi:hypothetical protein
MLIFVLGDYTLINPSLRMKIIARLITVYLLHGEAN